MRTDELIGLLAQDAEPVAQHAIEQRFAVAALGSYSTSYCYSLVFKLLKVGLYCFCLGSWFRDPWWVYIFSGLAQLGQLCHH